MEPIIIYVYNLKWVTHSSHPFRFISSALVMVRQAWSAGTFAIHGPIISGLHRISSLDPTLCWTRVEDIYYNNSRVLDIYNGFLLLLFFFSSVYLPFPKLGFTPPGSCPNARGWDACRGSNSLWTRTLDRYTRTGLPECVVSTMSGPPPETTQDRKQRTHTQSQDSNENSWTAGNRTRVMGLEGKGLYRPRHGDGFSVFTMINLIL